MIKIIEHFFYFWIFLFDKISKIKSYRFIDFENTYENDDD